MYNVTVLGKNKVGKSSLCSQWNGHSFSKSYCMTLFLEKYVCGNIVLSEVPSHPRFKPNCTSLFNATDIFVLVVNEDSLTNETYDGISSTYRDSSWMLVMNGAGEFPMCRTWARDRDIYMTRVNLSLGEGVKESFMILKELSRRHQSHEPPVSLVGEVYQWIPTCL